MFIKKLQNMTKESLLSSLLFTINNIYPSPGNNKLYNLES